MTDRPCAPRAYTSAESLKLSEDITRGSQERLGGPCVAVHNATTLEWEQISAVADGKVIDRFLIVAPTHGSFATRGVGGGGGGGGGGGVASA